MDSARIIILAGGKGKRMGGEMPKVLIKLYGRPLIEHLLDSVSSAVPVKPVVVVGFKGELVRKILGGRVDYAVQAEQLGTGHAVLCAKEAAANAKNIVVLYGDMPNIKAATIKKLLEIREAENPAVAMMTIKVPHFENEYAGFRGFGRVVRDGGGGIKKIVEWKDASDEEKNITELNPGLFCFDSKWLWENLPLLKNFNAQSEYYLTDMPGLAIEQGKKIISLEIPSFECVGVNTPDDLRIAGEIILGK